MSNVFFTSDTHFFHNNFILFGKREFKNVDEMNDCIISRWNEKVKPGDRVFHLGDFSFGKGQETSDIIDRLNGQIFYVKGNHESYLGDFKDKFVWVKDYATLNHPFDGPGSYEGRIMIVLSHYSFRVWDRSHRGTWNLYGHTHGELYDDPNLLSIDVGVDCHNYYPLSFNEVAEKMSKKKAFGAPFDFFKLTETNKCPICDTPFDKKAWNPSTRYCEVCMRVFE